MLKYKVKEGKIMKIYDAHIHIKPGKFDRKNLLDNMKVAGIYGGAIYSIHPTESVMSAGVSYEERIEQVLSCCEGYKDQLIPVLWIHPYEKDACKKAEDAASRGIKGFKMICDKYYVFEKECMELLRAISSFSLPVVFHSGILWDGAVSSKYNKPLNWEALMEIPKLKFALAHCSWPWYDECIALYGKFLYSYAVNPDISSEMFFDLTPGTPEIYRKDLLIKIFCTGYDVKHNVLFGTDSIANRYSVKWAPKWIQTDNMIYDEIKITDEEKELIYRENMLRFFGYSNKDFIHAAPSQDGES